MALERPLKTGNVRTYVEEAALGFDAIDAPEVDADFETIYAAVRNLPAVPPPETAAIGDVLTVAAGPLMVWQAPAGGGGDTLWADDADYNMLYPVGVNRGIRLPAGGDGLVIAHSTYPTIDRRTGIDADDNSLQIHAGASGILFKTWDSTAILAQLAPTGRFTLGADPTAALDAATKQYVDARASVDMTVGAYLGSNQTDFLIATLVPLMVVGRAYKITVHLEINTYQAATLTSLYAWISGNRYLTFTPAAGTPPLRHARLELLAQLVTPTALRAEGTMFLSTTGGFVSTPSMLYASANSSYTTPGAMRLEGGYTAAHLSNYMQVQAVSVAVI